MTRSGKRLFRLLPIGSGLVLLMILASPVGPWVLTRVLCHLAEGAGWALSVGSHRGAFISGFSLEEVRAVGEREGISAAVERVEVSPWSYAVGVVRPVVHVELKPGPREEETAVEADTGMIQLPVEYLPDVAIEEGRVGVVWLADDRRLEMGDLGMSYRATGDTLGELTLSLPRLSLIESGGMEVQGGVEAALQLSPARVWVDSLRAEVAVDRLHLDAVVRGDCSLISSMPFDFQGQLGLEAQSGESRARIAAEGAGDLQPLALRAAVRGEMQHPQLQRVALAIDVDVDEKRAVVDSLRIDLLGGSVEVEGEYLLAADSLTGGLKIREIDWSGLVEGMEAGPLEGELRAALNLKNRRYDVETTLTQRQLELLPGERIDVRLEGRHRADQSTRIGLHSSVLDLMAVGQVEVDGIPRAGSYDLELSGELRGKSLLGVDVAPVQIEGRARPDSLQVRLATPHLPGAIGARFGKLVVDLELLENRFLEGRLTLEEELLQLGLGVDLVDGEVDSLVSSLAPLAFARLVPELDGSVKGQARGGGALDIGGLHLTSRFEMPGAAYGDWRTGPVGLQLDYRDGVASCALEGSGLLIEAEVDTVGALAVEAIFAGAVLYGKEADPRASREVVGLTGNLAWRSDLEHPEKGEGHLALEQMRLRQGEWVVSARQPIEVAYGDGDLRFERLELQTPVGPLSVTGEVAGDSLDVALILPAFDVSSLAADLELEGEGEVKLEGTLERPLLESELNLRRIRLDTLEVGNARMRLAVRDSLDLRLELFQGDPQQAVVEVELSAPAEPLLQGIADTTRGAARLDFAIGKADLEALFSYAMGQSARGWLDVEGAFAVPLARLDSSLTWRDVRGGVTFHGMEFETEVEGDSLIVGMTPGGNLLLEEDQLDLRGLQVQLERYDRDVKQFRSAGRLILGGSLQGGSASELTLNLEELDLLVFDGPEGMASGRALIGGSLQQPDIRVALQVETVELGGIQARLEGDAEGGRLQGSWTTPSADSLTVQGELPWVWEQGRIDSERGWLHFFSEGVGLSVFANRMADLDHLDGMLSADLRVDGLGEGMALEGYVGVEDLAFALLDVQPTYRFPQGKLMFSGRRGELREFISPAGRKNGRMELSGHIDLTNLDDPGFAVQLETEKLAFRFEEIFDASDIDITLALEGTPSTSRLTGDVRLNRPKAEPVLVTLNAPPVPPPPPTLRDEFLENMELDVFVDIRSLEVDSELAGMEISGAIEIGGTFYKPIFQGDMEVGEGQVFILNRQFEFEKGLIVLNSLVPTRSILDVAYDPLILNPEVDVAATCKIMPGDLDVEHTVTMSIQGPAQTVAPVFSSDPALDFNDIFRLLAFGLASSDSAVEQDAYKAALGAATGQLLSKKVEKVGLDEFTVLPTGTTVETANELSVRMGRYFDELPLPLWVRYEAALANMSSGEVRVEHKIKSFLTLTGVAHSKEERYGLGVGLKKDF